MSNNPSPQSPTSPTSSPPSPTTLNDAFFVNLENFRGDFGALLTRFHRQHLARLTCADDSVSHQAHTFAMRITVAGMIALMQAWNVRYGESVKDDALITSMKRANRPPGDEEQEEAIKKLLEETCEGMAWAENYWRDVAEGLNAEYDMFGGGSSGEGGGRVWGDCC